MRMSKRHRKESTSEEWRLRALRSIVGLFAALLVSLTLTAAASANVSFTKAYGWSVVDGLSQFETCTSTCRVGAPGGGAGQLDYPEGIATGSLGDVYVADYASNRIDEFSAAGAFIRAWGWGVVDGASTFETCTSTCQPGVGGPGFGQDGAGQFDHLTGVATDSLGDVYAAEQGGNRIDEFSAVGAFIRAYGWGVSDGMNKFETCASTCKQGIAGAGAGELDGPTGVATDSSGDVYVADFGNARIDEFSAAGSFIEAYGWGVVDGASKFETCTSTCQIGRSGGGAGQLYGPIGVATDSSGDVYVADQANNRIDEFSTAGAFIEAYGWGVSDGASQFETCTSTCQAGIAGGGAGQLNLIYGVATDSSGDVYVADGPNARIDEFSAAGAFIEAYGWGVSDGASQFETCTSTCQGGLSGGGAGSFNYPHGVATDSSGDVYVADSADERIEEFSAAGASSTLSVSLAGTGKGSVSGSGISCPNTCANNYAGGTVVTLTALPSAGSTFTGWSGGGCTGTGTCVVTMSSDQSVTATFTASATPPQQTLTVSLAGTGSGAVHSSPTGISCPGTCSGGFAQGTVVTLTATPASGSTFTGWSGAGCSGTGACTVTMGANQGVTASFKAVASGTSPTPSPSCALTTQGARVYVAATHSKHPKKQKKHPPFGVLKLAVRCDQTAAVTLTGRITAVIKLKRGKKRTQTKAFTISAVGGTATAGETLTMTVNLPKAALAALERGARETVLFALRATNANGTGTASAKIARLTLARA
jgi:Divergent InlB B-repeat domain/NHL repeat